MKRTSKLILAAVLVVAVSLPLLAMASDTTAEPTDGIVVQDTQFNWNNCLYDEEGYCYILDNNGDAQRIYTRAANGQYMALRFSDGEYCWAADDDDEGFFGMMRNFFGGGSGRGCGRWN